MHPKWGSIMRSAYAVQRMPGIISLIFVAVLTMDGAPGFASGAASYDILHVFEMSPQQPNRLLQGSDGALYGTTREGGTHAHGTIFTLRPDGTGFAILHSFTGADGAAPSAGLIQGSDGDLYGTSSSGGAYAKCAFGCGTVFRLKPDGTGFRVLHAFDFSPDGVSPYAGLLQGGDGALYGTTVSGGTFGRGTVFRLKPDGTGYAILHSFTGTDGNSPYATLLQGNYGALYGTTSSGGSYVNCTHGCGTIFRIQPDGTGFTVIHVFDGSRGATPKAGLVRGSDGALYGTTYGGASTNCTLGCGTIFRLQPNAKGLTILHSFTGAEGANPSAGLILGSDGALYGTTSSGGASGRGTAFTVKPDGTGFSVVHAFNTTEGSPTADLLHGSDGALYGTTGGDSASRTGTIFKVATDGTGFTVLQAFIAFPGGAYPQGNLVQGTDGALYGTTSAGGAFGAGTIFTLNPDGTGFTVLHTFDYSTDGANPSPLLLGNDGALYGTTSEGAPWGTIFSLRPDGTGFTLLHIFTTGEGSSTGGLLQGIGGALYGTTVAGEASASCPSGCGTIFTLKPDGTGFAVLHTFDRTNGDMPLGRLMQGSEEALFGTTARGGDSGWGTIFTLNPDGTGFTLIHTFTNAEGSPSGGLLQGTDGALYGTTWGNYSGCLSCGGPPRSYGTVFTLNPDGTGFKTLHAFNSLTDGDGPVAGLIQGTDGALYGTTSAGGAFGAGTIFTLNPDGTGFRVLHAFDGGGDGDIPAAGLLQGSDGALYGTTSTGGPAGGPDGGGVIFRMTPPFTQQPPAVSLWVSQPAYHSGQQLTLNAIVSPGPASTRADVYIALQLLDGSLLFLQDGGGLTTSLQPFVANWPVGRFLGQLFNYTFGGWEPAGSYTWLAAFTQPGTLNLIGPIVSVPFSFSP